VVAQQVGKKIPEAAFPFVVVVESFIALRNHCFYLPCKSMQVTSERCGAVLRN
jgi:hypothetical protein